MTLSEDIKNRIKEHALAERPKECCGIIFENLGEWGVHQCPNHSEKPTGHFSISQRFIMSMQAPKGKLKPSIILTILKTRTSQKTIKPIVITTK